MHKAPFYMRHIYQAYADSAEFTVPLMFQLPFQVIWYAILTLSKTTSPNGEIKIRQVLRSSGYVSNTACTLTVRYKISGDQRCFTTHSNWPIVGCNNNNNDNINERNCSDVNASHCTFQIGPTSPEQRRVLRYTDSGTRQNQGGQYA